jgi:hypothetical protein
MTYSPVNAVGWQEGECQLGRPDLRRGTSMSGRQRPLVTGVGGVLMARRTKLTLEASIGTIGRG